jgi:serpin B
MTKHRDKLGFGSFLGIVGLGLVASACSSSGNGDDANKPAGVVQELRSEAPRVTPDGAEAMSAGVSEQEFAFGFLHALEADSNLAFSPHSLSTAFAMATDAADGKTLAEVEEVLHFGKADEAFHRSQDALELALATRNRAAGEENGRKFDAQILTESNDIWVRNDLPPQPSYLDTLARFYGVGVHQADFGGHPDEARIAINGKVSQDTHELIPELIPDKALTTDTVTVLTNAMYFKAPWATPLSAPVAGDFHKLDGSSGSAQMMKTHDKLAYYAGDGFVSVGLPYYGGELEMMLIVPDAGAYAAVRTGLSSELLTQIVTDRKVESVDLTLPKFHVKSSVPATTTLRELGMLTPFDPDRAEFPKLVSDVYPVVYISDVLHQATVAIDEKGTEASAATAIIFAGVSASIDPPTPKVVNADRPFLFAIRDNPTGSVLFVGQIVAPE